MRFTQAADRLMSPEIPVRALTVESRPLSDSGSLGEIYRRPEGWLASWQQQSSESLSGKQIVRSTLAFGFKVTCLFSPYFEMKLTFIKYSVHIKSICGTGLKISAATHIYTQLLDSLVLNHTGISATNLICRKKNKHSVCT